MQMIDGMSGRRRRVIAARAAVLAAVAALWPIVAGGQSVFQVEPGRAMAGSDLAVLEARETRNDLPCRVTPMKPAVGFDLKFHSGYEVAVPMRELAGIENLLTILFRVTSDAQRDEPVYFTQRIKVPAIEEGANGEAYLQGTFVLGEGSYQVDWLMRDRSERVCASFWTAEAALAAKDKDLALSVPAGAVAASEKDEFLGETPPRKDYRAGRLSVKVLVNFAPQNSNASMLEPADTSALVSILKTIQREPRITRYSVVAFNLQQQRVLYRQAPSDRIDFEAIGEAVRGVQLGRVDLALLQNKNSEAEFLGELIQNEFKVREKELPPDGLIIAGPKAMLASGIRLETLKEVGSTAYPVFYLNYNLAPQMNPWRDSISQAVRFFKGEEFTISRPRELWTAITEVVARIVKWKVGRRQTDASVRGSNLVAPR